MDEELKKTLDFFAEEIFLKILSELKNIRENYDEDQNVIGTSSHVDMVKVVPFGEDLINNALDKINEMGNARIMDIKYPTEYRAAIHYRYHRYDV